MHEKNTPVVYLKENVYDINWSDWICENTYYIYSESEIILKTV